MIDCRAGWLRYRLKCENAEEQGFLVIEAGASGIEVLSRDTINCYIADPHTDFEEAVTELGFLVESVEQVFQENWIQGCAELFKSIEIGKIRVVPIASPEEAPPPEGREDRDIYIVPGLGFGTGHHASTASVLQLLQEHVTSSSRALDLGTGSGILAIAANKLFSTSVDAVDVDPLALENAAQNIALNRAEGEVRLIEGGVECLAGKYDLVMANLYVELLVSMELDIRQHAAPGSILIASGITAHLAPEFINSYTNDWELLAQIKRDGWLSAALRLRS